MKKNTKNKNTKQSEQVQEPIQKTSSFAFALKSFIFSAILFCGLGFVFLYLQSNEAPSFPIPRKAPPQLTTFHEAQITAPANQLTKEDLAQAVKETEVIKQQTKVCEDCITKDKVIFSQTQTIKELNEKIHRLEIDNLNLSEKMAHHEKLTPLTIHLMEQVYMGKPFETSLSMLLNYDKTNAFALNIKDRLYSSAKTGIPTKETLKQLFFNQMEIAKKAFYISERNATWNQKWSAFFKSLIYVYPEKINPQKAQGIDWLFLAEQQVQNAQFDQALKSIKKLPPHIRLLLNNFVSGAHRYLEAMQIINTYIK